MDGLSAFESSFVVEYIKDKNATRAYMAVSPDSDYLSAAASASQLLRAPKVQAAVRMAQEEALERAKVDPAMILTELSKIAQADALDYVEEGPNGDLKRKKLKDMPRVASSVSFKRNRFGEQEVSFKVQDKLKALELLGKSIGLFVDVQQQNITLTDADREQKAQKLEFIQKRLKPTE